MAGFDRSKLRATTASALQAQQQELEAKRPTNNFERNILEIKPGDNKFRIFPFHPDSGISTYSVPKTVSFLTVSKPKRDENGRKVEGETELRRSPVFNGKVHGNLPKDLVEEYMEVAKKIAIPNFTTDKAIQAKIWNLLTYAGKGSKAIKPSDVWVAYAMKEEGKDSDGNSIWGKIGELELKKTVTAQLTEKAIEFSGNEMTPDIYTDPDEGICVIINKSGEGKDTEYKVSLETVKTKHGNQLVSMSVPTPLTDEQIDAFMKLTPLAKKYVNSFKRSDLMYQIEGLQNFDQFLAEQGYPINVFEYDEFLSVVDELTELVPEGNDDEEESSDEAAGDDNTVSPAAEEEVEVPPVKSAPKTSPAKATISKPAAAKAPAATVAAKAPVKAAPAASGASESAADRSARIRAMLNKK